MTKTRPHKFRPFTTRDGSLACADCYGPPNSVEHRLGQVSDEFVQSVEEECGMGAAAWDTIDPREIILAVINVQQRRAALVRCDIKEAVREVSDKIHDSTEWWSSYYADDNGRTLVDQLVDKVVQIVSIEGTRG